MQHQFHFYIKLLCVCVCVCVCVDHTCVRIISAVSCSSSVSEVTVFQSVNAGHLEEWR